MSVRPSAHMELGSHWTDVGEIWYLCVNSVEKFQVSLKTNKNDG